MFPFALGFPFIPLHFLTINFFKGLRESISQTADKKRALSESKENGAW